MYLKEIQGFRFVAALLVAIYHIWFHRVSGGVDAFFVVGGFFLFQTFLKRDALTFGDVVVYWRRTLARIVPTASVVILATCVLFAFFGTDLLVLSRIKSALASILFVENWRLALSGADYLSVGDTPSPFQQLWALSVQLQAYALLPALTFALFAGLRRMGKSHLALPVFAAVLGASFMYAIVRTAQNQPMAYFDTFARLWEFLAGGIVALVIHRCRISRLFARGLGYVSLAALVSFAAIVPVASAFPGAAALVPVLATVGIIISARNGGNLGLLTNPLMQTLGNVSFTFYLWHWPIYVFVWDRTGSPDVSLGAGIAIIFLSLALAFATLRVFEAPFRRHRYLNGHITTAVVCCALVLVLPGAFATGWAAEYLQGKRDFHRELAAFLATGTTDTLVPAPLLAKSDYAISYDDGCHQGSSDASDLIACNYGNPNAPRTIVLVGGSHTLQWLPAFRETAMARDFRITVIVKTGCALTLSLDDMRIGSDGEACLAWSRKAIDAVVDFQPDLVVTAATRVHDGIEIIPDGYRQAWRAIGGIKILAIRDNPRASFDIAACVDRMGPKDSACDADRPVLHGTDLGPDAFAPNITFADYSDYFCPDASCPATRENVLIYQDAHHITATAARVLASRLRSSVYDIFD